MDSRFEHPPFQVTEKFFRIPANGPWLLTSMPSRAAGVEIGTEEDLAEGAAKVMEMEAPGAVQAAEAANIWMRVRDRGHKYLQVSEAWAGGRRVTENTEGAEGSWGAGLLYKVGAFRTLSPKTNVGALRSRGGILGHLVARNPGLAGTFEVDADGKNIIHHCPPRTLGVPVKFAGVAYVARPWVLQWLVANSSLAHGLDSSPLKMPQLEFSKLRRSFASRHNFAVLRWRGGDGPFEQMYGLHFSWYKTPGEGLSSSLSALGVAQPL